MSKRSFISRYRWYLSALVVFLVGAGVAGGLIYQYKLYYHFRTVDPGKVYRSGCLSEGGLQAVHDKTGFRTIVAARSRGEAEQNEDGWYIRETEFCRDRGLHFEFFDMGVGQPPDPQQVERFERILDDPEKYPILIHCAHGVVRTSAMTAFYRVTRLGHDPREVWETVPRFGHDLEQYDRIKAFILGLKPGRKRTP